MNDLKTLDDFLSLDEARKRLPRPVSMSCMYRWASKGVGGVVLRTVKFGRDKFTTEPWLLDFASKLSSGTPAELEQRAEKLGV